MIKPLGLGGKNFLSNLIQGPLAGVSSAPFRLLTSRFSPVAFTYTEMISCKTLIHTSFDFHRRFVEKFVGEAPVCFQLSGNDPLELAEAVKRVTDYGADLIDLNCGCPVKKIRKKGAGSFLLQNPLHLYSLIKAMKQSTHLPVSIKIRVDGDSNDALNGAIAQVVTEAGCDFITVHGRHWTENYDTACRYSDIQFFVDHLKIPVIGNGDVSCVDSLKKMLATGCQGVMIARASVGQPWLIQQLKAVMKNEIFVLPSLKQRGLIFLEHVFSLQTLLGSEKFAILQARQFAKYYARTLKNKTAFCESVNRCKSFKELQKICLDYFSDI